jgi:transposase-like protein
METRTNTRLCYHCGKGATVRHGYTRNRKQRFRCRDCGRCSMHNPGSTAHSRERRWQVLDTYRHGDNWSLRCTSRFTGVSRTTLTRWIRRTHQPDSDYPHAIRTRPHGCPDGCELLAWVARNEHRMTVVQVISEQDARWLAAWNHLHARLDRRQQEQGTQPDDEMLRARINAMYTARFPSSTPSHTTRGDRQ